MSRHDCRRCEWKPEPDADLGPLGQAAEHAARAGHPLCILCSTSLPTDRPQSCLPCLAEVRRSLGWVVELYALLPAAMAGAAYGEPGAPRSDGSGEGGFPGGDLLVMLAGGSRATEQIATDAFDVERTGDPQSVAFELGRWEDDWRLVRGEPEAVALMSVAGAAGYLEPRMGWAADHHPAFDEFARDVRALLSRLRTATATDEAKDRGAPCLSCDATLERERKDRRPGHECRGHGARQVCPLPGPHGCTDTGGRADEWRCPRCHRTYSDEEYARAMMTRWRVAVLARRREVGWTVRELAVDLGISESGVRQIVRRQGVARTGTAERGAALYDPDEVRQHAQSAGLLQAG